MTFPQARISEQYFQALLRKADAVEAVYALSGSWAARLDDTKPLFGVSYPEYQCQLILIYSGEVGNGGHSQFFLNRGVRTVGDLEIALKDALLPDLAEIMLDAVACFEQEDTVASETMQELDQTAWKKLHDVDRVLQAFLLANETMILRQERGLLRKLEP